MMMMMTTTMVMMVISSIRNQAFSLCFMTGASLSIEPWAPA